MGPMWILPMSLRAKLAAITLLGIFFVPFATSDLRGLPFVLSCEGEVETSLYVGNTDDVTVLGSADSVTVDDLDRSLCDGLRVDLQLASTRGDRAEVLVLITNGSEHDWQGSVELRFDGTPVPVAIGAIDAGTTGSDTVEVRIRPDSDYEIEGVLRIGP